MTSPHRLLALPLGALLIIAAGGPPIGAQAQSQPAAQTQGAGKTPPVVAAPVATPGRKVRRRGVRSVPRAVREVAAATRGATQEPRGDAFIHAVQVYPFSDGALYQVYAAPEA